MRRGPGPLAAAVLSAILPGLGHFGHRNGRALFLITATLVATAVAVVYAANLDAATLLAWGVTLSPLRILVGASLSVLVLRVVIAVDAYQVASRRSLPVSRDLLGQLARLVLLVLVAVVIAAPHIFAIRFALAQMTLLSDVFDTTEVQTASPTPLPTTTITPPGAYETEAPVTEQTFAPPSTTSPPPPTTTSPTTTTTPPTWDGERRLTVALLGSDAGFDRYGVRTDTVIVLTIEVATGDAVAFSIPRNWRHVTFPWGTPASERWPRGYPGILNEVYGLGLQHPDAFPGVEDTAGHAVKSALAQLTGLHIHFYVLLDMVGFVKTIDLFGGIDIYVTESINDRIKPIVPDGLPIYIEVEPGQHHFNGLTALGYVRSRTGSTDWNRMTRQRCVVGALIDQVPPAEVIYRYSDLTEIIADHVETDIPLNRLDELIGIAGQLDTSRITTVNFIPPEFPAGDAPIVKVRQAVLEALLGGPGHSRDSISGSCSAEDLQESQQHHQE